MKAASFSFLSSEPHRPRRPAELPHQPCSAGRRCLQRRPARGALLGRDVRQRAPHPVDPGPLMCRVEHSSCGRAQALVIFGDHQLYAALSELGKEAQEGGPEGPEGLVATPSTSRLPSSFTPHSHHHRAATMRPPSRTLRLATFSRRQGHAPSKGQVRKALTRSSISTQRRLTRGFDMPPAPITFIRSSTERVETPWPSASCIVAKSAFPAVRRGSKKSWEVAALAQRRDLQRDPSDACFLGALTVSVPPDLAQAPPRPSAPRLPTS